MQNWIAIVGPAKRLECKLDLIPGEFEIYFYDEPCPYLTRA